MEQSSTLDTSIRLQGSLPSWLNGTFYFSGPSHQETESYHDQHLFDGFAQIHAISIQKQSIIYKSQFIENDAYVHFEKTGKLRLAGFGQTYYRSWPKKLFSLILPELQQNSIPNTAFAINKFYNHIVSMGHLGFIIHDRNTLIHSATINTDHNYAYEVPYMYADEINNTYIGLSVSYKNQRYGEVSYTVYSIDNTLTQKTISVIHRNELRYMHTFCVTQNYIILIFCPLIAQTNNVSLGITAFIKNFTWMPEKNTEFLVIDRKSGKLIKKYSLGSFFCLYQINAFEDNGKIILDLATYHDSEILTNYYVNRLKIEPQQSAIATRYTLSEHEIVWSEIINRQPIDYVAINSNYIGKKYDYIYASEFNPAHATRNYNYISKIDIKSYAVTRWYQIDCYPSESIFVPNPTSSIEDEGILVNLLYNSEENHSFLLLLHAQTMKEIARITFDHPLPHPLRGMYIPNS